DHRLAPEAATARQLDPYRDPKRSPSRSPTILRGNPRSAVKRGRNGRCLCGRSRDGEQLRWCLGWINARLAGVDRRYRAETREQRQIDAKHLVELGCGFEWRVLGPMLEAGRLVGGSLGAVR